VRLCPPHQSGSSDLNDPQDERVALTLTPVLRLHRELVPPPQDDDETPRACCVLCALQETSEGVENVCATQPQPLQLPDLSFRKSRSVNVCTNAGMAGAEILAKIQPDPDGRTLGHAKIGYEQGRIGVSLFNVDL
jgi:hypothetical protein